MVHIINQIQTPFPRPQDKSHNLRLVTVKLHLAEFPEASVAAHSTVVTPSGNVDPDSVLHKISGDVSTLSVAVGLGQDAWEDVVITSFGQITDGATVSIGCSRARQSISIN